MATILKIDETSGPDATTQDVNTALPAALSSAIGASTIIEKAEKTAVSIPLTADTMDLSLTNQNGSPLNGVDSGLLTIDGRKIFLYTLATNNNIVVGRVGNADGTANAGGALALAIYLETNPAGSSDADATSVDLWVVELGGTLQHNLNGASPNDFVSLTNKLWVSVTNPVEFDATGAPSGSNLFITYGDGSPAAGEAAVVVTAVGAANQSAGANVSSGNVVKTSQAGAEFGGATFGVGSQKFDPPSNKPADAAYFTFVKGVTPGLTVPNLDATEANIESNIQFTSLQGATKVSFIVSQLQPASDKCTVQIGALVAGVQSTGATSAIADDVPWTGADYIDHQDQNTQVDIDKVSVVHAGGTTVFTEGANPNQTIVSGAAAPAGLTVSFAADGGLGVVIAGLVEGNKVIYESNTEHDRLRISNPGNSNTALDGAFDIGGLKIESGQVTQTALGDIEFYDDGPSVNIDLNPLATLVLDETDNDSDDVGVGGILATKSIAAAAYLSASTQNFGADGAAASNSSVWSLALTGANAAGVDSGLDDAATDANVMLFQTNATTITGKVGDASGATVLVISISSTTGEITVTQSRAVEHDDNADHDESTSPEIMNSGLVSAVRTVTDKDNDAASDSVDVSQVLKLEDDGPAVDLVLNGSAEIRLDETDNDADDLAVGGILATKSLAVGSYLSTNTSSFGSDGAAASNSNLWSLTLTGANAAGVDSGLDDAVTDQNVMLFQTNATTITGKVGGAAGQTVLTMTINSSTGELTVTQERAVEHNDSADPDEAGASSAMMNSGLVFVGHRLVDGDGDSASDSVDVSQIVKLEDDGPSISAVTNTNASVRHDETAGVQADTDVASGAFISGNSGPTVGGLFSAIGGSAIGFARSTTSLVTNVTGNAGSDGPAAQELSYGLSVVNATASGVSTTGGTAIFMYNGTGTLAGLILGRVGNELAGGDTANANGAIAFALAANSVTGEIYQAQYLSLLHPTGGAASFDETISLADGAVQASVSRTDGDGDSATDANNNIGLLVRFDDDGPGITAQPAGSATPNNLEVANRTNATGQDSSSYALAAGSDGTALPGVNFSIIGPADTSGDFTWAYFNVDGVNGIETNEIRGSYKGNPLYTLELEESGSYTFKMIGTLPSSTLNLNTEEIKAGGPQTPYIDVGAIENDQFVRISGSPGNINESNDFVGVGNGNFEAGETISFQLREGTTTVLPFLGFSIGTKSAKDATYTYTAYKAYGSGSFTDTITVMKGDPILVDPPGDTLFNRIDLVMVSGNALKIGLGDIDIFVPPVDVQLGFSVRLTDDDGDYVDQSFTVDIDGNLDGIYSSNVNALSLPFSGTSTALKNPGFVSDTGMAPEFKNPGFVDDSGMAPTLHASSLLAIQPYDYLLM